jgi:hypothetical protein
MYQSLYFKFLMKYFISILLFSCLSIVFDDLTPIRMSSAQELSKKSKNKKNNSKKEKENQGSKSKKSTKEKDSKSTANIGIIHGIEQPKPTLQSLFSNFQNQSLDATDSVEIFKGSDTQKFENYLIDESQIELLILGPTDQLNGSFGHVALKVNLNDAWSNQTQSWVYDLGQSPTPAPPLSTFLFGHSQFQIKKFNAKEIIKYWQSLDRSIVKIPLAISYHLSGKLYLDLEKLVDQSYTYHPFRSNCATNIRDLLDRHLHGKIFEISQIENQSRQKTDRNLLRSALKDQIFISAILEIFGGNLLDQPKNLWQMAYYPDGLWQLLSQVQLNGKSLLGEAQIIHDGKGALQPTWFSFGQVWLYLFALFFFIIALFADRQSGISLMISKSFVILTLALLSIATIYLNVESTLLELRQLPALLAFLPTDLLLLVWPALAGVLGFQSNATIEVYFKLRMICLGIIMLLAFLWMGFVVVQFSVLIIAISALFAGQKLFQEE